MSKVLVFKKEGKIVTDSLTLATEFGKRHDNVLRDIDAARQNLSNDFQLLNFEELRIVEENAVGRSVEKRVYNLTRNGWMYVVMGFTGKKAAAVKEVFLKEFDRMEAELVNRGIQQAPLTQKELLQIAINEIERLEGEINKHVATINSIQEAPVTYASTAGLRGIDIFNQYPAIADQVKTYMAANKSPNMKGPGAYTTDWLKRKRKIFPKLRVNHPKGFGSQLFDAKEIEALINDLAPEAK